MAMLLSFPARVPAAGRAVPTAAGSADIVILPCIRRERMGEASTLFAELADEMPTQRQA